MFDVGYFPPNTSPDAREPSKNLAPSGFQARLIQLKAPSCGLAEIELSLSCLTAGAAIPQERPNRCIAISDAADQKNCCALVADQPMAAKPAIQVCRFSVRGFDAWALSD
jgi:hypothetical protein